jgi:hypothetical protein
VSGDSQIKSREVDNLRDSAVFLGGDDGILTRFVLQSQQFRFEIPARANLMIPEIPTPLVERHTTLAKPLRGENNPVGNEEVHLPHLPVLHWLELTRPEQDGDLPNPGVHRLQQQSFAGREAFFAIENPSKVAAQKRGDLGSYAVDGQQF